METSYLPKQAAIMETCSWLQEQTGETWTLARLLEYGLMPWFWLDYSQGWPAIFGDRVEGYLAPVVFTGDTHRLEAAGGTALVNMTRTHDGVPIKIGPPALRVPIHELRFLRDDIKALSEELSNAQSRETAGQTKATPKPDVENDWRVAARMVADECFDRDTANNCRDSLGGYSKRVMAEMQKRGIKGPRGIIDNVNTVQRDALQAEKWWGKKAK